MIKPTEAELEILQILWEHGDCTVRFVNDKLNEQREVGYTTTLKMMQLMFEKGLLKVSIVDRSAVLDVPSLVGTDEGDEGEEEGS